MSARNGNNNATVLVVDDDINNLDILIEILGAFGFTSIVATDGLSALEKAEAAHPDLVLLDVMMPGIDGFETCRRLKSGDTTKGIPVIFITALSEVVNKVKGFEAGGVDYITKPFQNEEVISRINAHLAIARLRDQVQRSEARYRSLMELSPVACVVVRNSRIVLLNTAALSMLGAKNPESILDGSPLDLFHPDDRTRVDGLLSNLENGGSFDLVEERIVRPDGSERCVEVMAGLFTDDKGSAMQMILHDITERKKLEREREKNIEDLEVALATVKQLKGMLPICMYCKKIRNDVGYWEQVEEYITEHADVAFSHGLCDDCYKKYYPEIYEEEKRNKT